ncbi:MAG: hypothetical protein E7Z80_04660 [Methanobrevibacter thaueri]|nr:hypothetical protein [Methanobrevibacter thaueri]
MRKLHIVLLSIVGIIVVFLGSTIVCPVLIVAEDTEEDASIDMAATFSLSGLDWVYPGSTMDAEGHTLHNVYINHPEDPYGAARDLMTYCYNFTPHIIVSVNNAAAQAIFGDSIIKDIRANDAYQGYAGNDKVPGTMSRGDAVGTAMAQNGMNVLQIPVQIIEGNIRFIFV